MKPAGVILAAGASSRMGQSKATLKIGAETFLDRAVRRLETVCDPVVVVLGHYAESVRGATARPVAWAENPSPDKGMMSSLQAGLRAAGGAALFMPVDLPEISEDTVRKVAAALAAGADVAVPVSGGKRGHPVGISRAVTERLLAAPVTARANELLRAEPCVEVPVDDPGAVTDIDTPSDYREMQWRVG